MRISQWTKFLLVRTAYIFHPRHGHKHFVFDFFNTDISIDIVRTFMLYLSLYWQDMKQIMVNLWSQAESQVQVEHIHGYTDL